MSEWGTARLHGEDLPIEIVFQPNGSVKARVEKKVGGMVRYPGQTKKWYREEMIRFAEMGSDLFLGGYGIDIEDEVEAFAALETALHKFWRGVV